MYDSAIHSFHQAGDVFNLAVTLTNLASTFNRFGRPEIAATVYGSATRLAAVRSSLPDRLRSVLEADIYEDRVRRRSGDATCRCRALREGADDVVPT